LDGGPAVAAAAAAAAAPPAPVPAAAADALVAANAAAAAAAAAADEPCWPDDALSTGGAPLILDEEPVGTDNESECELRWVGLAARSTSCCELGARSA